MTEHKRHPVTIYDVAAAAGVSPSTVSRTFARPGRVSARTAARIREVAQDLGYRTEAIEAPPALPSKKKAIGLSVSDVTNPFYFGIIRGAEADAAEHGYAVLLIDVDYAIRDARVLARRVATMIRLGEECGTPMAAAIEALARGVRLFEDDLGTPAQYAAAQEQLVDSVRGAVAAASADMTLNRAAVAAQVRSLAADVLLASGMTQTELDVRLNF